MGKGWYRRTKKIIAWIRLRYDNLKKQGQNKLNIKRETNKEEK